MQESKRQIDKLYEIRLRVTRRVAHDLRNFLGAFSSALQLASNAPEKLGVALRLANRQVLDMKALTDEMVEYAVVLSSRTTECDAKFSLRELYEELVHTCQPAVEQHGLAFYSTFDESLSMCVSNRLKVKQIALNLLGNETKYTRSGSVGLLFDRANDSRFRLSVTDTGVGICEADQARVFEEFQRAGDGDVPGTGLGLAIVHELIVSLGGEVKLRSAPGAGSVFEVFLPLKSAAAS
jgi:signal transduction histidine kinase